MSSLIFQSDHQLEKFFGSIHSLISAQSFETTERNVKDLLDFESTPSTRELAILSQKAYDIWEISAEISDINGFYVTAKANNKSNGYQGYVFFRPGNLLEKRHHQFVISHKGTENMRSMDIVADYDGVMKNQTTDQLRSACTFAVQAFEEFADVITKHNIQLIVTGHSLGGWLCQVSTFALKRLQIFDNVFHYMEKERCHPHCEVFDSPGATEILRHVNTFRHISNKVGPPDLNLDITNFVILPNCVNVVNSHYGDLIKIPCEDAEAFVLSATFFSKANKEHTDKFHGIDFIINVLTNVERNCLAMERVVDWPLVIVDGANTKMDTKSLGGVYGIWIKGITRLVRERIYSSTGLYEDWLQGKDKKTNFKYVSQSTEGFSYNCSSICREEHLILDGIREFYIWKKYSVNATHNNEMLQELDKMGFGKVEVRDNRLWVPVGRVLDIKKVARNCSIFFPSLVSQIKHLPGYDYAAFLSRNETHCRQTLEKYSNPKFAQFPAPLKNSTSPNTFQMITDTDIDILRLVLLQIMSAKYVDNAPSLKNTLIVKYDEVGMGDFVEKGNNSHSSKDFSLPWNRIVVDGIDYSFKHQNHTIQKVWKYASEVHHIWLTNGSSNFDPNFEIDKSTKDKVLSQQVLVQGCKYLLKDFIFQPDYFFQNLILDPKNLLTCLAHEIKLDLDYHTEHDLGLTYFEVGLTYSKDELSNMMKHKIEENKLVEENAKKFVFYGRITELQLREMFSFATNSITVVENEQAFVNFRNLTKQNPHIPAALFQHRPGDIFIHSHEYVPDFYVWRKISPPKVQIASLLEILSSKRIGLSFNSNQESNTVYADERQGKIADPNLHFSELDELIITPSSDEKVYMNLTTISELSFTADQGVKIHTQNPLGTQEFHFESKKKVKEEDVDIFTGVDFFILAYEPGMGKSTTVVKMIKRLVYLNNNKVDPFFDENATRIIHLVLYFDSKAMKNLVSLSSHEQNCTFKLRFADFVANNFTSDRLTALLLTGILDPVNKDKADITLVFDGFDELEDKEQNSFRKVLKGIRCETSCKVLLTTRGQCKWKAEWGLGTLAHTLHPIDDAEKPKLLKRLWSAVIKSTGPGIGRIQEFADAVVTKSKEYLKGREDVLGVALQLRILSQVFLNEVGEFVGNFRLPKPEYVLREAYSLTDIYDAFLDRKYKIYVQRNSSTPLDSSWAHGRRELENNYDRYLFWLAGRELEVGQIYQDLCTDEFGQRVKYTEDVVHILYGIGVIYEPELEHSQYSLSGKFDILGPRFLHKTLAQFYVCKFIVQVINRYKEDENWKFQKGILEFFKNQVLDVSGSILATFINNNMEKAVGFATWLKLGNVCKVDNVPITQDILLELCKNKQPYLLSYTIQAFEFSCNELQSLLQRFNLNLTFLYLKKTHLIRIIFVLLRHLSLVTSMDVKTIPFLLYRSYPFPVHGSQEDDFYKGLKTAVGMMEERLKRLESLRKTQRPLRHLELSHVEELIAEASKNPDKYPDISYTVKPAEFYYSINDLIELFDSGIEISKYNVFGVNGVSRPEFILRNPCASLLLMHENFPNLVSDFENLVTNWEGEFDNFPFKENPDLRIASVDERHKIMVDVFPSGLFSSISIPSLPMTDLEINVPGSSRQRDEFDFHSYITDSVGKEVETLVQWL